MVPVLPLMVPVLPQVLDPEQNHCFTDAYLGLPFDLSRAVFVATANKASDIPPALLDRLEVIQLPGYTLEEKVLIARKHLVPKLLADNGLGPSNLRIGDEVIGYIVDKYTREAGVRGLSRALSAVCRHVAVSIVNADDDSRGHPHDPPPPPGDYARAPSAAVVSDRTGSLHPSLCGERASDHLDSSFTSRMQVMPSATVGGNGERRQAGVTVMHQGTGGEMGCNISSPNSLLPKDAAAASKGRGSWLFPLHGGRGPALLQTSTVSASSSPPERDAVTGQQVTSVNEATSASLASKLSSNNEELPLPYPPDLLMQSSQHVRPLNLLYFHCAPTDHALRSLSSHSPDRVSGCHRAPDRGRAGATEVHGARGHRAHHRAGHCGGAGLDGRRRTRSICRVCEDRQRAGWQVGGSLSS